MNTLEDRINYYKNINKNHDYISNLLDDLELMRATRFEVKNDNAAKRLGYIVETAFEKCDLNVQEINRITYSELVGLLTKCSLDSITKGSDLAGMVMELSAYFYFFIKSFNVQLKDSVREFEDLDYEAFIDVALKRYESRTKEPLTSNFAEILDKCKRLNRGLTLGQVIKRIVNRMSHSWCPGEDPDKYINDMFDVYKMSYCEIVFPMYMATINRFPDSYDEFKQMLEERNDLI